MEKCLRGKLPPTVGETHFGPILRLFVLIH